MKELGEILRDVSDRLDLPQPARSRVILEIAADLRDMEEEFVAGGMDPGQARRAAFERCDLSDEAIAELVRIHAPPYRRFLDRLSVQAKTRWERGLLVFASAVVVLTAGGLAADADLFRAAGPVGWVGVLVVIPAVLFAAARLYSAFVVQNHDPVRLRRWLIALPGLAAYNLLLAAVGAWGGFYRVAWRVAADPDAFVGLLTRWLRSTSAASVVCLLGAILIAVLWFVLENKISRIEEAEAAALLQA